MPTESRQPILALITIAVIAFAAGYLLSPNASEMSKREVALSKDIPVTPSGKRTGAPNMWIGSATLRGSGDASSHAPASEHPESREFFARINVTKEDLERVAEMEKRRTQGEYILQNERPTTKKFLEHDFGEIVSQAAAQRATEYNQLFAQAEVAPEAAEQLKVHVAKIHRASLEAEVAIQQVLQARRDYNERLHSTMSEQNYKSYRQEEEAKPAIREYQELQVSRCSRIWQLIHSTNKLWWVLCRRHTLIQASPGMGRSTDCLNRS
jgi:hypothetical protein